MDYGASGRLDSYSYWLVDPYTLDEVRQLSVEHGSASLTWAYYTDNKLTGSITILNDDIAVSGREHLIRIKHTVQSDGEKESRTLATMFMDTSDRSARFKLVRREAACYSVLWRFTKDCLIDNFNRPKGAVVIDSIRDIVTTKGGKLFIGTGVPTGTKYSRPIFFPIGMNLAEVITEIASWIGCQIGITPEGYISLEKYIAPENKGIVYTFEAGSKCVYKSGFESTDNRGEVVNQVVAYFSREKKNADSDPYPPSDRVIVQLPDSSRFAASRIGRQVTHAMQLQPMSHDEMLNKAQIYLNENSGEIQYIIIEHAGIPKLRIGDMVRYINTTDHTQRIDCICQIIEMDIPKLHLGCLTKSKLKVVRWQ